jgi:glucose/arabinose dehydrogenase
MRRGLFICTVLIGALLAPAAPARADTAQVITIAAIFVSPVTVMQPGDSLVLNNQDLLPHNLVSQQPGLFATPTINPGTSAEAAGASSLPSGVYPFVCTLHPWMLGALAVQDVVPIPVLPGGDPLAPPSTSIGLAAGVVPTPTSVTVRGNDVYATSYAQGALFKAPIVAEGLLGASALVADGFTNPLGVVVDDSTGIAFVSDSHPSTTGRTTDGRVWAVNPNGTKETVIDGLPNGRHNTNGMAVKDGRLYITNGNSTDDGVAGGEAEVPPYSGSLLSVPVTGRNLAPTDATVEATGMRNVYDVAFRPGTNEAWMTMNGPDALEPFGEDLLVKVDVSGPSVDFGFPGCVYRAGPGGPTDPEAGDNPVIAGGCGEHTPPEVTLGLHVSADGLAFGPETSPWNGDLFIAEFGNFFGAPAGRKTVRVPVDGSGNTGAPIDAVPVGAGPLDVAFGPSGLYVADFLASTVLLIRPELVGLLPAG